MAEFVQGFESLAKIGPCVSIFGSARTKPGHKYYELAVEIAQRLAEAGFGIITGGGPGIMEAANKGANLAKGRSVGLGIALPFEQSGNIFIKQLSRFGNADIKEPYHHRSSSNFTQSRNKQNRRRLNKIHKIQLKSINQEVGVWVRFFSRLFY